MNETNDFSLNICRICLENTNDLSPMSNRHIVFYRTIVNEVANEEFNMKTCSICAWMLQKFTKFKNQCQLANKLLKDGFCMDSKSFVCLQSMTSSHNLIQTKLATDCYSPFILNNDTYNTNGNTYSDTNDTYKIENDIIYDNDSHLINTDTLKSDNDRSVNEDTFEYDTHDNVLINNDEDEIPLVLLRNCTEETKKKSKRKKKKRNETLNQATELLDATEVKCKRKKKEPRDGFTSRMVQETNEYVVIKLTREQVLQEMEERSQTDSYKQSLFRCEKCVKGFNFKDVLHKHLEKHSMKNGLFLCGMCYQYCPSAVSLRGHVKSHTTRYKCKLCGHIRLSRQHLLEHHAISHTGAPPSYKCEFCQFTTTKRTVMQRHVRNHADGDPHACDKCGKLFKSIESLRLHTARYHDKSSHFRCDRCDDTFVYQSLLRKHVSCVHERREYYCVECDVQFKSAESLRLHFTKAKKHRDITACKYSCPHCPSRFFTGASLAVHLSDVHNETKAYPCPQCHRSYSSRDAVRTHKWRSHSRRESRALCAHCDASFARKSSLKLHMRSHAGRCDGFAQDKTLQTDIQDKHKNGEKQQYQNKIEVYTHIDKVEANLII